MIKLSSPSLGELEKEAVCRVLDSHAINMGAETYEFERELKEFFGRTDLYTICVNSCTAALHLSMQAVGVGYGDEVLIPTYTFISSFQAVSATGAIPIPVDIDFEDGFINVDDAQSRITNKTKAVTPVLFAGCGNDKIYKIYELAKKNNLRVIEDAAHSFGDENIAKRAGTLCFSFDAIKNITCSDGGCVLTNSEDIASKIKDSRLLGVIGDTDARYRGKRSWDSDTIDQGWRYHMSNVCSAIGRAQLKRFNSELKPLRQKYSKMYINGLRNLKNIQIFPIDADVSVPHIFPIITKNGERDALKAYLLEKGIESGVQYKPNHLLTKFYREYNLPNAEKLYANILSIPLHPKLSEHDVQYVIEMIIEWSETRL
jgi:dTDP-4-amino-4,6-dideoxygalactose transaminase